MTEVAAEIFVRLDVREINRIAEALADADGEQFNQYTAARYRSLARASLAASSGCIRDRMAALPQNGRHTRASWMVAVLEGIANVGVDDLDDADEQAWG